MKLEIQFLAWDRHRNVAEFNEPLGFQSRFFLGNYKYCLYW